MEENKKEEKNQNEEKKETAQKEEQTVVDPKQQELDELNDRYKRVLAEVEKKEKHYIIIYYQI